ncbi:MAG TPA: class I SAM-dependent methyltransferase [Pyrinomonadaceae bacterium]|nr:class I SAM-dependent methyltransferase [Pyrinomonadaceae bacterium]
MPDNDFDPRERVQQIQSEFAERGDTTGWFDALYKEAAGNTERIPWADLEPNPYFKEWAERNDLSGDGRSALVVGCGLGDDANYLNQLGFKVSAFDLSPTAIDWAKKLYGEIDIRFEVMNLFEPYRGWLGAFDFVLEIYTIQPLPMEMREDAIDAVSRFVKDGGELVVVTRGREDDEPVDQVPWPLSRKDLSRFEVNGLRQTELVVCPAENEGEPDRWVIKYDKN